MKSLSVFPLLVLSTTFLFAQNDEMLYTVQVGAFEQRVGRDYFDKLEGVYEEKAPNDIWYYFLPTTTKAQAESLKSNAIAQGFTNARVVDLEEIKRSCSAVCSYTPSPPKLVNSTSVGPIFFDFDKSDLRAESTRMLDRLYSILYHNPGFTADILANTDAKGSNEYNDNLSKRRARAAINYLRGLGIAASRLKTSELGEVKPAAKNELENGADTEEGRQLNRRVDLIVKNVDGTVMNQMIEPLSIPSTLQLKGQ